MKNNAGIIGQIEVMQHHNYKAKFCQNTQYATKFIKSEVKRTWIS